MVSKPYPSILGSLPPGVVDITEEMRGQDKQVRKLLFEEEGPILKSSHGKCENVSQIILTESGSTSSTGQSTAEACRPI